MATIFYLLIAIIILAVHISRDFDYWILASLVVLVIMSVKIYNENKKTGLMRKENSELKTKQEELDKENSELKTKQEELDKENSELKTKQEELDKENSELKTKQEELDKENSELKTKQEELDKENSELKTKQELDKENSELKTKQEELDKENSELKTKQEDIEKLHLNEIYNHKLFLDEIKEIGKRKPGDVANINTIADNIISNIRDEIINIEKKYYPEAFSVYFDASINKDTEYKKLRALYNPNNYRNDASRKNKIWAQERIFELDNFQKDKLTKEHEEFSMQIKEHETKVIDALEKIRQGENREYIAERNSGEIEKPIYSKIPKIQIDKDHFHFSITTGTQIKDSFVINNVGEGILEGIIKSNRKWLKFSKDSFNIVKNEDIRFDIDTLYPSGFMDKGIIEIISNGGAINIYVEISIIQRITE